MSRPVGPPLFRKTVRRSRMVPVPVASSRVAWLGLDRVRVRVSWPSSSESVRTVTSTVWEVSPALKVRVALAAV